MLATQRVAVQDVLAAAEKLELYESTTAYDQEHADERERALDHFNACVEYYYHVFILNNGTGTASGTRLTP
jgi:hypothetical protein